MAKKLKHKPEWIKPGMIVDYHSIIGGPVTRSGVEVLMGPELLGGHTWVVWLQGEASCVAVDACSPPASQLKCCIEGCSSYGEPEKGFDFFLCEACSENLEKLLNSEWLRKHMPHCDN